MGVYLMVWSLSSVIHGGRFLPQNLCLTLVVFSHWKNGVTNSKSLQLKVCKMGCIWSNAVFLKHISILWALGILQGPVFGYHVNFTFGFFFACFICSYLCLVHSKLFAGHGFVAKSVQSSASPRLYTSLLLFGNNVWIQYFSILLQT